MKTATESIGPQALSAILAGRAPRPQRFYKVADTDDIAFISEPQEFTVDEGRMAVGPVVISTPAVDRVGDVLIPTGCKFDNYARNPVVLWDHGFSGEEGGSLPIASAGDPDGNLTFEVTDEAVTSWAYFHGKTLLSDQVFSLVASGVIKAASVRPTPIVSSLITHQGNDVGILMEEWEITEWSFVAIGCNQEALVKSVRDNRLLGKKLAVPLLKSLKKYVPEKSARGIGMALKRKPVTKSRPKSEAPEDDEDLKNDDIDEEDLKTVDPEGEEPEATGDDLKNDPGIDDDETKDDDEIEPSIMKLGAQVLSAMHVGIKELAANIEAAVAPVENDEVKNAAVEMVEQLKTQLTAIEGLYSAQYPDQPALIEEESDEEKNDTPDEEALKSFLASGILNRSQWVGHSYKLKSLVTAKNLTPRQRRILNDTIKGMRRVEKEARGHVKSALEVKLDAITKMYNDLQKKLNDYLPHQRG